MKLKLCFLAWSSLKYLLAVDMHLSPGGISEKNHRTVCCGCIYLVSCQSSCYIQLILVEEYYILQLILAPIILFFGMWNIFMVNINFCDKTYNIPCCQTRISKVFCFNRIWNGWVSSRWETRVKGSWPLCFAQECAVMWS